MRRDNTLSEQEKQALSDALRRLSKVAGFTLSVDSLLNSWLRLVTAVERGYADSFYEYTNDLAARDLLEDLAGSVGSTFVRIITDRLNPLDHRFFDATIDLGRPLLSGSRASPWSTRVPRKLVGELRDDLEMRGLLPPKTG